MSVSVLLVEDEQKIKKFVEAALKKAGMMVESCSTLVEALEEYLERQAFDVVVLDRMLGQHDSIHSIAKIKSSNPLLKILFLSALGDVDQKVYGLQQGADDYLAKPFHVAELVARIQNLARRSGTARTIGQSLQLDDLVINLENQTVVRQRKEIALTSKEFKLLTLLARHPKKMFSKFELLDRVWGLNSDPESNVVEVTVKRLRDKVDEGFSSELIHTKRGSGYWCESKRKHE